MPAAALQTLRRLQRARTAQAGRSRVVVNLEARQAAIPLPGPQEALTRETFLELVEDALARVGAAYVQGLLEWLSEEDRRPIDEAEVRVDAAFVNGDLETAREALEAWERAWCETIQTKARGDTA